MFGMEIPYDFDIKNGILAFFIINEFIFAILIFKRALLLQNKPNFWLGFLAILCAMYLVPWTLGHAGWYSVNGYRDVLLFIPFHQYFLFGPVILFLTKSLARNEWKLRDRDFLHFIPAGLYFVYTIVIIVTDLFIREDYYFYADGIDKDYDLWYQLTGLIAMVIYALVAIKKYNTYTSAIYNTLSFADSVKFKWLKQFLFALILIIVLRGVFIIIFPEIGDWGIKFWYYFLFGIISFYITISGYSSLLLSENLLRNSSEEVKNQLHKTSSLSNEEIERLFEKFKSQLEQHKWYQNPTLTLTELAAKLNTNTSILSKTINEGAGLNFNDFINGYRIEIIKKQLHKGALHTKTLEGLALDSGFNSKSTFLRAFKKQTGMTPSAYLKLNTNGQ